MLTIAYLIFTVYQKFTKVKALIIAYYFVQKLLTRSFMEKRPFLSIRKDITSNYFKSNLKRANY